MITYSTFEALQESARATFLLIMKRFGLEAFHFRSLEKTAGFLYSGARLSVDLLLLRRSGFIVTVNLHEDPLYMIPPGIVSDLQQLLMPFPAQTGIQIQDEVIESMNEGYIGLVDRLLYLLSFIAKRGLTVTKNGSPQRRQLKCLLTDIGIGDETIFNQLLEISIALKVVQINGNRYVLCSVTLDKLLHLPVKQLQWAAYQAWLQLFSSNKCWFQLAALGISSTKAQWFAIEQIEHWLLNNGIHKPKQEDMALLEDWLENLVEQGWVECGEGLSGNRAYRWLEISINDTFYVQPDFEIIVPPNLPFSLRWEVECLAERISTGSISHYRITKESIGRAVESGRTTDELIDFLNQNSKYGIPPIVEMTIQNWSSLHYAATSSGFPKLSGMVADKLISDVEVENEQMIPSIDHVYPGLQQIPALWLKEPRVYHLSTKRDIIEQAMRWKASVNLIIDGIENRLSPTLVQEEIDDWYVRGYSRGIEMKLSPNQWQQMLLLLPGINEK